MIDIVLADRANTACIISIMDEADVRAALAHPLVSFGTDSGAHGDRRDPLEGGLASARLGLGGADPRPLRARREGAAPRGGDPQDDLLRGGGGRPAGPRARQGRLPGRPRRLRPRDASRDRSTFTEPNQYSEGFRYVAVNGVLVVDDGKLTGKTPGKALRGPGYQARTTSK